MLHPKTDERVNPIVEAHHLVGKLSTAETLLTEVQHKVPKRPGQHLFVIRERLYAHPVYIYIYIIDFKLSPSFQCCILSFGLFPGV